jgi:hypothetical protein
MSDLFYKVVRLIGRHAFWVSSRPVVFGIEHVPRQGACVIASNHTSPYDVALLMRHTPRLLDFVSIVEVFKQTQYQPMPVELQVSTLWAIQNGHFDDVPVASVKDFQNKLQDFFVTRKDAVLAKIRDKGAVDDAITEDLKTSLAEFKQGYKA